MPGLIPRSFIQELLTRCDIVEVIDVRVSLKKRGSHFIACCPFHQEKTPSFTVSQTKQFYHCFGCGENGNAISFLMTYDRLTFVEAVEELARKYGLVVPRELGSTTQQKTDPDLYTLMDKITKFYEQALRENSRAVDYLKKRNITGHTAKQFRLGYAPAGWENTLKAFSQDEKTKQLLVQLGVLIKKPEGGYYDRFRDRVIFPIRDRQARIIGLGGRVIGEGEPKYLNSPETPLFHKGRELFGLYEALKAHRELKRVLVVEGYLDVMTLVQHGLTYAVATLGTATTSDHLQRLFRLTSEIVFCFDGDRAGKAAAWKALEVALPQLRDGLQIRFLLLPEGEDPDSLIQKEGLETFEGRIESALTLGDFLFSELKIQNTLFTSEGRAKFAKEVLKYVRQLPENVFQILLYERLAKEIGVDVLALKHPSGLPKENEKDKIKIRKTSSQKRSPMRWAIALLLQHPELIASIPEDFFSLLPDLPLDSKAEIYLSEKLSLPGMSLLTELLFVLKKMPETTTTGVLLEYWRDNEEAGVLHQLAMLPLNIPPEGLEQECLATLERLKQTDQERKIELLMQKAKTKELTLEEKNMFQKLASSLKKQV